MQGFHMEHTCAGWGSISMDSKWKAWIDFWMYVTPRFDQFFLAPPWCSNGKSRNYRRWVKRVREVWAFKDDEADGFWQPNVSGGWAKRKYVEDKPQLFKEVRRNRERMPLPQVQAMALIATSETRVRWSERMSVCKLQVWTGMFNIHHPGIVYNQGPVQCAHYISERNVILYTGYSRVDSANLRRS